MSAEQENRSSTVASPSAREAIRAVADRFVEFGEEIVSEDPLDWPGYEEQLARTREKSGEREAVVTGEAYIGETPVVIIAFDFNFLGGARGERVGGQIVGGFARARGARRLFF